MRSRRSLTRYLSWLVLGIEDPLEVLARHHEQPWLARGVPCYALGQRGVITGAKGTRVVVRLRDGRSMEVPPDRMRPLKEPSEHP